MIWISFTGTNTGLDYFSADRASRFVRALQFVDKFGVAGYDVTVRAAGDGAVGAGLSAAAAARREDEDHRRRHRISGLALVDEEDVGKFDQIGVVADLQVHTIVK